MMNKRGEVVIVFDKKEKIFKYAVYLCGISNPAECRFRISVTSNNVIST